VSTHVGIFSPSACGKTAASAYLKPPVSGPDRIPLLADEIARLCDSLRGARAYLGLCAAYPSTDPLAPARVREAQLHEQNALYLLREMRKEIVLELDSLIA
jgi:hypothetical protein